MPNKITILQANRLDATVRDKFGPYAVDMIRKECSCGGYCCEHWKAAKAYLDAQDLINGKASADR